MSSTRTHWIANYREKNLMSCYIGIIFFNKSYFQLLVILILFNSLEFLLCMMRVRCSRRSWFTNIAQNPDLNPTKLLIGWTGRLSAHLACLPNINTLKSSGKHSEHQRRYHIDVRENCTVPTAVFNGQESTYRWPNSVLHCSRWAK